MVIEINYLPKSQPWVVNIFLKIMKNKYRYIFDGPWCTLLAILLFRSSWFTRADCLTVSVEGGPIIGGISWWLLGLIPPGVITMGGVSEAYDCGHWVPKWHLPLLGFSNSWNISLSPFETSMRFRNGGFWNVGNAGAIGVIIIIDVLACSLYDVGMPQPRMKQLPLWSPTLGQIHECFSRCPIYAPSHYNLAPNPYRVRPCRLRA